ncbi:MAG TPA: ABC transporter substrate-binding protein [Methylomirabilota bacterium]
MARAGRHLLHRVLDPRHPSLTRLALLLLATALVGCAGRPEPEGAVRLVFRHAAMPGERDPLPALLREFERLHPGVTVQAEALPWTADVQHQFFVINLEGRSAGFDVLMLDVIWVAEFARAGWILDLSDRFDAAARAEHFPSTITAATLNGRVWAVPWVMNVGLLYYRRDLLARRGWAAPTTYEELARQALALRGEGGIREGFLWQGKQYEGLVVNVLESFWALGTDVLGPSGDVLPDPALAAAALAQRRAFITDGVSPALVTAADEEVSRREFGAGAAVFLRNWPYALALFEAPASPVRGRVAITALPGGGALGGAHLAINAATRYPTQAWELVRFLTRPEAQRRIGDAVGLHPTRPALFESPALLSIFRGARARPVTPWYQTLSATLQPELSAAITGVKPPARALDDARGRLRYLLLP